MVDNTARKTTTGKGLLFLGLITILMIAFLSVMWFFPATAKADTEINITYYPSDGGTATYQHLGGELYELTATPNPGYKFVYWSINGQTHGNNPTISINIEEDSQVTISCYFEGPLVTTSCDPIGGGTETGGGYYAPGETVTVTATPNDGYVFLYWADDEGTIVSDSAVYSFDVTGDTILVAHYRYVGFLVTTSCDSIGGGTETGGGYYTPGETATVTATPNDGYVFLHWAYDDGTIVSDSAVYSFDVTGDTTLVAHYKNIEGGGDGSTPTGHNNPKTGDVSWTHITMMLIAAMVLALGCATNLVTRKETV